MRRAWFVPLLLAVLLPAAAGIPAAAFTPANSHFQRTWERVDQPVSSGVTARTWIWGPEANSPALTETYVESPGSARTVQYYDKSRMEITHPDADPTVVWYVTNGLLVVELMSGNLQLGDAAFEPHDPAQINVAGNADDPLGPTYATMALLRDAPPRPDGDVIDERVERDGRIYTDPDLAFHGQPSPIASPCRAMLTRSPRRSGSS